MDHRYIQFFYAILVQEALAVIDLLLAVREVLRVRRALGRLRALILERGEDLKHKRSVRTPRPQHPRARAQARKESARTSSGSSSSSSSWGSSSLDSSWGSCASLSSGASAWTTEKTDENNDERLMVDDGRS